jgi:hypothetical protein
VEKIKTIADTIVWVAEERMERGGYKSLISTIHVVLMEVGLKVGERMNLDRGARYDRNHGRIQTIG